MKYTIVIPKEYLERIEGKTYSRVEPLRELIRRGHTKAIKDANLTVVKKEFPLTNYKWSMLFWLMFAYPAYWLVRFIIWSIRTLRTKEA